ncbi:uncharacterized protein LOC108472027 [Gossypium arboreum]|uniref:uncharacterized protein LOC108472027 n=1 Tax=Gossypium arboreum TaxID=29729 RepID=UPI0008195481|nr:uncharacterized protein LOC108472027 [Gossypium arboreum]
MVETIEVERWIRLRSDGAVKFNIGCVVIGGVRMDHNGNWIFDFNRGLGNCSVFEAELWGILNGVMLIQGRIHDKVLVQTENMKIIGDIKESLLKNSNSTIIRHIAQLLQQMKSWCNTPNHYPSPD